MKAVNKMKLLHPSIVIIDRLTTGEVLAKCTRGHRGVFDMMDYQVAEYIEELSEELWQEDKEMRESIKPRYITSWDKEYDLFEFNPTW